MIMNTLHYENKDGKSGVPIALLKTSAKTSVFLTSALYTSLPTIGQNGTFAPNSCATASARAVLPVPGAPANSRARPLNFRDLIRSTTTPHACIHALVRKSTSAEQGRDILREQFPGQQIQQRLGRHIPSKRPVPIL
jgi:hypothetical protein